MSKATPAQLRAIKKYQAANYKQIICKLHKEFDADIINALDQSANKQAFIKAALREYITKNDKTS